MDSATRYLWLFPLHHKTAEAVAAAFFDEAISSVSVLSAIFTDRGGEFTGGHGVSIQGGGYHPPVYLFLPPANGHEV